MGLFIQILKGMAVLCIFFRGLGRLTGFCNSVCDRYKLLTLPRWECTELFWHPDWWSSCLSSGPGQKQQKKKCANELKKCEGQGPKVSRWMQPRDGPDFEQYKTNGYERDKAQQQNKFTACFGHLYPEGWDEQNHSDASANILQTLRALCRSIGLLLWSWPSARYNSPGFICVDYI